MESNSFDAIVAGTGISGGWAASRRPTVTAFTAALPGYFTLKVGITENMEYVPVPTAFHGCVPLSQMEKHVYRE